MKFTAHKGQNLIEAIFAIAVFLVLITGTLFITSQYLNNELRSQELLTSKMIIQESKAALDGIATNDWNSLTNGTHGLNKTNGYWEFSGNSDVIDNKFTRTVTISDITRDGNCQITTDPGDTDPDSKQVSYNLNWDTKMGPQTRTFEQLVTNWDSPTFCLAEEEEPGPVGQAGDLGLDIVGAVREEFFSWINLLVTIDGVEVTNESSEAVTIDMAQVFMNESSMDIYGFFINDSKRWGWFGPGSPGGQQPSGTTLDISNYTIDPGETVTIKMTFFTGASGEITFSINFIMEDGSEVETDEFTL